MRQEEYCWINYRKSLASGKPSRCCTPYGATCLTSSVVIVFKNNNGLIYGKVVELPKDNFKGSSVIPGIRKGAINKLLSRQNN